MINKGQRGFRKHWRVCKAQKSEPPDLETKRVQRSISSAYRPESGRFEDPYSRYARAQNGEHQQVNLVKEIDTDKQELRKAKRAILQ